MAASTHEMTGDAHGPQDVPSAVLSGQPMSCQYTARYVAARHGLIGLMRNIALELAPYGIRCNAVSPGAVQTR